MSAMSYIGWWTGRSLSYSSFLADFFFLIRILDMRYLSVMPYAGSWTGRMSLGSVLFCVGWYATRFAEGREVSAPLDRGIVRRGRHLRIHPAAARISHARENGALERPDLQLRSHLSEPLLIHGPNLVLANSGQDLKSPRAWNQKTYEQVCLCSVEGL